MLVGLCVAAAAAAVAQELPSLVLEDGSAVIFSETGAWSVVRGGVALASESGAALWAGDQYKSQAKATDVALLETTPSSVAFRGTLNVGGVSVQFTQSLRHLNRGLMVTYAFEGVQLAQAKSVAAELNLPLPVYRELPYVGGGEVAGKFPVEVAAEPRLVAQPLKRLVVATTDRVHLLVEAGQPQMMVLQDSRGWGMESYQLLIVPEQTAEHRAVSFFVAFGGVEHGPRVTRLEPSARQVGQFEPFELTLDFWGNYENPYNPDNVEVSCLFESPSRRPITVAGFLYQDYQRSQEAGKEALSAVGPRVWKVRFAPTETGTYAYALSVKTKDGISPPQTGSFLAVPSSNPGFLRVSSKDRRFFEFSTGRPFFGVGHNVCWGRERERTYDYDLFFGRMQQAGENLSRIWFCSWDMALEGTKLDDYQLDNAWRMDYVLNLAAKSGIYVKLCLDNFHDYRDEKAITRNPYFEANGGPIKDSAQFFSDPTAAEHYRRRLRYIVARWAHMPAVLAWEQWNEANYALYDRPGVAKWSAETARYLHSLDPYGHLISTTLGPEEAWAELWSAPELDFVQHHTYIRGDQRMIDAAELDAVELITKRSGEVAGYGKPFVIGEFGYVGYGESNPLNEKDKLGVALHNAIWASAFSGAAATAANWWWDSYIHPNDLYYHYEALAKFVREIDWTGGAWRVLREDDASPVRIRGIANSTAAYLWIQQRGNSWYSRVAKGQPAQPLRSVTLNVANLADGNYQVEWWNTYSAARITHYDRFSRAGLLALAVPNNVGPDVACKVLRKQAAR